MVGILKIHLPKKLPTLITWEVEIVMHHPGSSLKNSLGKNPYNTKVPKFGTPYHLKSNLVSPWIFSRNLTKIFWFTTQLNQNNYNALYDDLFFIFLFIVKSELLSFCQFPNPHCHTTQPPLVDRKANFIIRGHLISCVKIKSACLLTTFFRNVEPNRDTSSWLVSIQYCSIVFLIVEIYRTM